jgi:hypothetical protein
MVEALEQQHFSLKRKLNPNSVLNLYEVSRNVYFPVHKPNWGQGSQIVLGQNPKRCRSEFLNLL